MHGGKELVLELKNPESKDGTNDDRVNGSIDDVAGRVKRQIGEWTEDTDAEIEGLTQQMKGKAEKAWGTVKDAVGAGNDEPQRQRDSGKYRRR